MFPSEGKQVYSHFYLPFRESFEFDHILPFPDSSLKRGQVKRRLPEEARSENVGRILRILTFVKTYVD